MAYQALYRQWRPLSFSDFVGQQHVVTTLKNQIMSGRIAHAYLFCGTRGTGKTSAAKIMARAVNCLTPVEGDPCGTCQVCVKLASENTMDIVEIDAASNNGVDEIRDLREKIKYPPQEGRYRVYIIDEVHMLSTGAFNALLKTLEEPPPHGVFILATTEPQKLPATILSRCQRYDFHRFPAGQIVGRLRQVAQGAGAQVEEAALERIARAAEGGMRDAVSILDMCLSLRQGQVDEALVIEVLGASDKATLYDFVQALIDGAAGKAFGVISGLMEAGRDALVVSKDVATHLRGLMLAQSTDEGLADLLEVTQEEAGHLRKQAQGISRPQLLRMLDVFLAAEGDMKWATQPRVALELAAARACLTENELSLEALLARVAELERKLAQGVPMAAVRSQAGTAALEQAQAPLQAQAAPKATASQPPSQVPAGGRNPKALWEEAAKNLRKQAPLLCGQLMFAQFEGREGNTFKLTFEKQDEIHLNVLNTPDKIAQLETALSQVAGDACKVSLALKAVKQAPPPSGENPALAKVFDAFGRENVQVLADE